MTVADIKSRKPTNGAPLVFSAIAAVMSDVSKEGIGKDRRNDTQGYKFRGIDDVYNALAPVLAKHDLCIVPSVLSREVVERKNQKGNALFYVTCQVEFTLICANDGSSIKAVTYGEAMDSGDKATNKAMSAAYKYMAMQTFCIPTEGDNDADQTTHEVVHEPRKPTQNASQAKKADVWPRFVEKLRSFTDLDDLERWWSSASTQAAVDAMPGTWPEQAHEEYEKKQEALASAGAPWCMALQRELPSE